jgi:hypothetical protein
MTNLAEEGKRLVLHTMEMALEKQEQAKKNAEKLMLEFQSRREPQILTIIEESAAISEEAWAALGQQEMDPEDQRILEKMREWIKGNDRLPPLTMEDWTRYEENT